MDPYQLTSRQLKLLVSAYDGLPNEELAKQLNLLDSEATTPVTADSVRVNARRLHLKKDRRRLHMYYFDRLVNAIGKDYHNYCGTAQKEIRRVLPTDCSVIKVSHVSDLDSIKNACYKYNRSKENGDGVKIRGVYDKERLLVLLTTRSISHIYPCTSQSSPGEAQCVPP